MIANRLSTVRKCDLIYEVEDGHIKAFGDFDALCRSSKSFKEMYNFEIS